MLDEPMGSLDRALRERLPEELRGIFAELGLTVIYVTHDQDEALTVADRVVLLDAGRIVADDTPEELWTHPPTAWAARFLGFRNIAAARVLDGELVTPWGRLPRAGGRDQAAPRHGGHGGAAFGGAGGCVRGPIRGRVAARRFRGDHRPAGDRGRRRPDLQVEAREGELPAVGDGVSLARAPRAVSTSSTRPWRYPLGHERRHPPPCPPASARPLRRSLCPMTAAPSRILAAQRGRWVVLFFYPKDFTSGCTTEVCEFRDLSADFEAAGATVWSVSVLDAASKAKFKAKHQLDVPAAGRRRPRGRRALRRVGREEELRQVLHGHRPDHVPDRPRGIASPTSGPRSSPRGTRRSCSRHCARPSRAADGSAREGAQDRKRRRSWGETSDVTDEA